MKGWTQVKVDWHPPPPPLKSTRWWGFPPSVWTVGNFICLISNTRDSHRWKSGAVEKPLPSGHSRRIIPSEWQYWPVQQCNTNSTLCQIHCGFGSKCRLQFSISATHGCKLFMRIFQQHSTPVKRQGFQWVHVRRDTQPCFQQKMEGDYLIPLPSQPPLGIAQTIIIWYAMLHVTPRQSCSACKWYFWYKNWTQTPSGEERLRGTVLCGRDRLGTLSQGPSLRSNIKQSLTSWIWAQELASMF